MQDVKSLGKKGDIVNVSDGYARNYILPKKLGVEANKQNLHELNNKKNAENRRRKEILDEARQLAKELEALKVNLTIKVGEGGKTFGSITTKEIASAVKEQSDLVLDRKKIQISEPIKNAGSYTVGVKLHPKVTAELKVEVQAV